MSNPQETGPNSKNIYVEAGAWLQENSELLDHNNPIHTPEAYFALLLQRGLETRKAGNYGIAAVITVQVGDVELLIFGENRLVTDGDPSGHAEATAFQRAARVINYLNDHSFKDRAERSQNLKDFITSKHPNLDDSIVVRAADKNRESRDIHICLWTSLEPCLICTGVTCNGRIHKVVWAVNDERAGQMHPIHRLPNLAPLWPEMFKNQKVELISAEESPDYDISEPLRNLLSKMFFDTKQELDEQLETTGFMNWIVIAQALQASGAL